MAATAPPQGAVEEGALLMSVEEAAAVAEEDCSAEMLRLVQRLIATAKKSGRSLDALYQAQGKAPPGVFALAVMRLAADEEEQLNKLFQLMDPRLQQLLQGLGVLDDAVSVFHYTSALRLLLLKCFCLMRACVTVHMPQLMCCAACCAAC
jgi:hypothetical protein